MTDRKVSLDHPGEEDCNVWVGFTYEDVVFKHLLPFSLDRL